MQVNLEEPAFRAGRQTSAGIVVATDPASVNADYDNGTVALTIRLDTDAELEVYTLATLKIMARQTIDKAEN